MQNLGYTLAETTVILLEGTRKVSYISFPMGKYFKYYDYIPYNF